MIDRPARIGAALDALPTHPAGMLRPVKMIAWCTLIVMIWLLFAGSAAVLADSYGPEANEATEQTIPQARLQDEDPPVREMLAEPPMLDDLAALDAAAGVDASPRPKWLDLFCIGNEECATGDFNGDGKADVLAFYRNTRTGSEAGDVWVALSTGSKFAAPVKWHESFCNVSTDICKVGDFNGDGRDDVASFRHGADARVLVALSAGNRFQAAVQWSNYFCPTGEVCDVGDFDGDGRDDIIAFTRSTYTGNAVGDVYVGRSTGGSFLSGVKWQDFFCILTEECGVGDFNADGRDDVISFTKGSSADVYVGISSGASFANGTEWHDFFCAGQEKCDVGDFNGDGRNDVIAFLRNGYDASTSGDVFVGISEPGRFVSGLKWHEFFCTGQEVCAVGDFDGDGSDDVVRFIRDTRLGTDRGDVYVALSTGTAMRFDRNAPLWHEFFCVSGQECATGDVNGDGRADVISFARNSVSGSGAGDVHVALSEGYRFGEAIKWHEAFCTGLTDICRVGDVNGDRRADLISFTHSTDARVYVALSAGNRFGAPQLWSSFFCPATEVCDIGDFNGDGRDDVVAFARSAYPGDAMGDVFVGLSTGGSFQAGAKWQDFFCILDEQCGTGDFNGDGRDDLIAFARGSSADVFVGVSTGASFRSGDRWNSFFCAGSEACAVGDFDGNGREDVVTFLRSTYGGSTTGNVSVGQSTGSGFTRGQKWSNFFCIGAEQCGTGDFNGDGRTDALTFLRNTQAGTKVGDVYVALAQGSGLSFSYYKLPTYLPAIRYAR